MKRTLLLLAVIAAAAPATGVAASCPDPKSALNAAAMNEAATTHFNQQSPMLMQTMRNFVAHLSAADRRLAQTIEADRRNLNRLKAQHAGEEAETLESRIQEAVEKFRTRLKSALAVTDKIRNFENAIDGFSLSLRVCGAPRAIASQRRASGAIKLCAEHSVSSGKTSYNLVAESIDQISASNIEMVLARADAGRGEFSRQLEANTNSWLAARNAENCSIYGLSEPDRLPGVDTEPAIKNIVAKGQLLPFSKKRIQSGSTPIEF